MYHFKPQTQKSGYLEAQNDRFIKSSNTNSVPLLLY